MELNRQSVGYTYRVVHDPWDSFGDCSCFKYYEVLDMLHSKFLAEGTKFDREGTIFVVVCLRGRLTLKRIGGK